MTFILGALCPMHTGWIDRMTTATHRRVVAWRTRREAARLRWAGSDEAHALADVLDAVQRSAADPDEAAWMTRIEALRERLCGLDEQVTFRDYGAGSRWQPEAPASPFRTVTCTVEAVNRSSAPPHEAHVLFHLIRRFRPAQCLELGTCLGISAAYQAAALAMNGAGRLITLEGGAALARRASNHLAELGLRNVEVVVGPFQNTLPGVLTTYGPFDYAFVDGHHDPNATRAYIDQITPQLNEGAVLIVDDVAWSVGMRKAWNVLANDPRLSVTADLWTFGIGLLGAA